MEDYYCPICSSGLEETCMHLFFECTFSQDCWAYLGMFWNLNLPPLDMMIEARIAFGNAIFREIVSLLDHMDLKEQTDFQQRTLQHGQLESTV